MRALLALVLLAGCSPPDAVDVMTEARDVADTAAPGAEPEPLGAPGGLLPSRAALLDPAQEPPDDEPPDDEPPPEDEDPPAGTLRLVVIDVGQGDALLLVSPDGSSTLVDAGKSGSADAIEAALAAAGVEHLDHTLVSHLHSDHLGAMDEVLAAHPEVLTCWDHGGEADSAAYDDYAAAAAGCRARLRAGDQVDLGGGALATVLHPSAPGDSDENANSLVLRVTLGGVVLLLGGDCPEDGCEERLDPGPVDIYKVHHHGSAGASSAAFLERIQPALALIPVGDNSYGHPTAEALDRLEAVGAQVLRTDLEGDIALSIAGGTWRLD